MAAECAKALAEPGAYGVSFVVPKGGMPKGFPRGELFNEMRKGGQVQRLYSFDPARVIAWLIAKGLVVMERTADNVLTFRAPSSDQQPHETSNQGGA